MSNPAIAQYDWNADFGVTLMRTFILRDSAGDPVNVTGYDAQLKIRRTYGTAPVLTADAPAQITVGTTNGDFDILVPAASMIFGSESVATEFVYDIVITDGDTNTIKMVEGKFTLHPTSTRS